MSVATARTRAFRVVVALALAVVTAAVFAGGALAQGVTTGAVRGHILDEQGQPVVGATVLLVNRETGTRFTTATGAEGSFYLANVVVGLYSMEARSIGYRPMRRDDVTIVLGQVADIEMRLPATAVTLEAINVTGSGENALLSRARTGATAMVTGEAIENLPSLNRSFTDLAKTTPLVNGFSFAGAADRFNAIQVDGGANGDLFGLAASGGSPGGRNDSRPVSMEAIKEYQVLIAPFDVRQGGFTGGLVNAITRSGTNEFHGSAYGFYQSNSLQGRDTAGVKAPDFSKQYYGFSIGGPIIRDRFHFFVSTEWRRSETPFQGIKLNIQPGDTSYHGTSAGLSSTTAERIRNYAINTLGFDPGSPYQPTIPNPDRNIFLKLSGQLGPHTQAEIAYNNVHSNLTVLTHDPFGANPTRLREGYQFSGSGYNNTSDNHSIRARVNSQLMTHLTNEFIGSYYTIHDLRDMPNDVSLMIVGGDSTGAYFGLGGERFSHANLLDQKILELTDNVTWSRANHVFTLGGRYERFKFLNVFFPESKGAWLFPDTTAFFNNAPTRYEHNLPGFYGDSVNGRRDGPIADFVFSQFGLYAQDQWSVSPRFAVTFGVRADFTSLPTPTYNPLIDTTTVTVGPQTGQAFGVRTDSRPTDALLLSPRLGFNYDIHGDRSLLLRGGIGVFSGRTPYVWASNAYTNTGLEQVTLTCTGAQVPAFTIDPAAQPTACVGGGALALPRPSIVYFDKNFKLPQVLRASLGADRQLPWNMVGTVDLLFTHAINQFILEDVNLVAGGFSTGEGNRQLYGTMAGGSTTPRRAMSRANDVLRQFNSNRDYSYSLSFTLNKRFSNNLEFAASYAYSRSYDLISPSSDISNSLLNFSTLDGTFANRHLTQSFFDIPHTVRLSGTTELPYGVRFSLIYTGNSGRPYAYRYNTDVNGDNFSGNDLFYVPLNAQDITLANPADYPKLDAFINSEACLRDQRGHIMRRNSCRNPWVSFVDARVSKTFPTLRGQSIELIANMYNVMALLGIGGENRVTSFNENIPILTRTGYSAALGRGTYTLLLPQREVLQYPASRWKLEFGARYSF